MLEGKSPGLDDDQAPVPSVAAGTSYRAQRLSQNAERSRYGMVQRRLAQSVKPDGTLSSELILTSTPRDEPSRRTQ